MRAALSSAVTLMAKGSFSAPRGEPTPGGRSALKGEALLDLLVEAADEARGQFGRVATGAERVLPLARAETVEALAGPADVGRREVLEQLLPAPGVAEVQALSLLLHDERLLLELGDVVALGIHRARFAQREAQVAHHVPAAHAVARLLQLVEVVLARLQVAVVEQQ